ncbi:DUF4376 domain-containing protein [Bradyrhizobium erythrophlei]|uniref:DUF4376 domain-containing protein n=1 Tax=Bradyrhizobium erythrophlei TaxID=1437360 RepID=A0A1M5NS87_9BRAD|nr:DUF4376 domain-containing protein [Bradyrhizobium erythrophlei]SHG92411.1 protein of unknown function [Bradyrhizobium erythrophlei]
MLTLTMTAAQASVFCTRFSATEPAANPVWNGTALLIPDAYATAAQTLFAAGFAPTAAELISYANTKQSKIMGGGTLVSVGNGVLVECSTDPSSLVLLQGAASIAATSPTATFNWVPTNGTPITLVAAQMTAMFASVSTFLQATFTTLSQVITAINAGTITTTAQVDTPPSPIPAWPVNS